MVALGDFNATQWTMGHPTDVLMRFLLSLLLSQMDVPWTSVRRTKWYQIRPSQLDLNRTSSKDVIWTSKRLHRETCTFKQSPSRRLPDVHWEVTWTSFCSWKAFDFCEFSNQHLEAFISYMKQRKLGIQLNL